MSTPVLPLIPDRGSLTKHRRPLPALTGIRFFAAFVVVVFHSRVSAVLASVGYEHASNFFINGYTAVTLFFLLSGFILSYTYRQQVESTSGRMKFWIARFARIWPVYAFSLLCVSIPLHSGSTPPFGSAVAALFMVQAWNPLHPYLAGVWNFPSWTISVEAFFYLVFPWIQLWMERFNRRGLKIFATMFLALAVLAGVPLRGLGYLYSGPWHLLPLPVVSLPTFILGMMLGNLFLTGDAITSSRTHGICTWAGVLITVVSLCCAYHSFLSAFVLVGYSLLVYGMASENTVFSKFFSTRALLFGGAISYSVYLLQLPVRLWVKGTVASNGGGDGFVSMLSVLVVLFVFASLTYLFIEEPCRKWLRARFAALTSRSLVRSA